VFVTYTCASILDSYPLISSYFNGKFLQMNQIKP